MEVNEQVIRTVDNVQPILENVTELITLLKDYHAIYAPLTLPSFTPIRTGDW
jgi:hypothetical protein